MDLTNSDGSHRSTPSSLTALDSHVDEPDVITSSDPPKCVISDQCDPSSGNDVIETKILDEIVPFEGESTVGPDALSTVALMTNSSLALKHQSDTLIFNIRGRHQRVLDTGAPPCATLADILPFTAPIPTLDLAPVTRSIGPTGRIRVAFGGRSLSDPDLMGWGPGALSVTLDGAWAVLRPDESERTARRNDGRCSFLDDARVRITEAVCLNLGLHFGDEVALLLLRDRNALALTNPARLLLGAPLSLVGSTSKLRELVHA